MACRGWGDVYAEIYEAISQLEVIDTHEHTRPFEYWDGRMDLGRLLDNSYVNWCFAGPAGETWEANHAYIEKVKANSYYRWLFAGLKEIYSIEVDDLDFENWKALCSSLTETYDNREKWRGIWIDKFKLRKALLDPYWVVESTDHEPDLFQPVFRVDMFLFGYDPSARDANGHSPFTFAQNHNFTVKDFDDYLDFVDYMVRYHKGGGAPALKCASAYDRDIDFQQRSKREAGEAFGKDRPDEQEIRVFQDYVFYHICHLAMVYDLPLQIHTGLGLLRGSNPLNLLSAIEAFPDVHFVLFHGGFPWLHQASMLAHHYANVYLDLVWLPLIAPSAAKMALHEWIEIAPQMDRIFWGGGDAWTPEESYGALLAARHIVAQVLAEKVAQGYFSMAVATEVAQNLFFENAVKLYDLDVNQ